MNHMTYRGYTARMDFDINDKIIVGRVIDIDDIITFHSGSVAEFEAAFNAAVDSCILAFEQLGQARQRQDDASRQSEGTRSRRKSQRAQRPKFEQVG